MDFDLADLDHPIRPALDHLQEGYAAYFYGHVPDEFEPDLPADERYQAFNLSSNFDTNFLGATQNRCFVRTARGLMGIGPYGSQKGDIVTLLFGANHFIVLRPTDKGYLLVGDAYVHGGMFGEFTKNSAERRATTLTQFRII